MQRAAALSRLSSHQQQQQKPFKRARCQVLEQETEEFLEWLPTYTPIPEKGNINTNNSDVSAYLHPALAAAECETDLWSQFGSDSKLEDSFSSLFASAKSARVRGSNSLLLRISSIDCLSNVFLAGLMASHDLEAGTLLLRIPERQMVSDLSLGNEALRASLHEVLQRYLACPCI